MRKMWPMKLAAAILSGVLAVPATLAAPQQQQQSAQQPAQPSSSQTPPQSGQQSSSQPPAPATTQAPDPTTQQPAQTPPDAQSQQPAQPSGAQGEKPVTQSDDPNVKAGSKQDVNAIGNRTVGHGLNFYSLEHEIALGKQLAQEVERNAKFIQDPVVTEYVNRVAQNLVRNSDAQVPFTVKVIDSDQVNAFALPGGYFFVMSGLILHADEESEMAGAMAHEIAHVCARHGTKTATKGEIMQLASIPAMIFIPYGWAGYAIYQGMNFAIPLTFLKFTRDQEREADYLGLQYMYKAGYDPNAFVSFFEKVEALEKKQPGTIPKVFSTHPPTPDRIESAQKEIQTILPARSEYIVTTSEFDTVKRRLMAIEMNQKISDKDPSKPQLRKKTDSKPTDSTTTAGDGSTTTSDPSSDGDDRPTLKRRPDNF
jgi:Zn-dependent protease with chaperone function